MALSSRQSNEARSSEKQVDDCSAPTFEFTQNLDEEVDLQEAWMFR